MCTLVLKSVTHLLEIIQHIPEYLQIWAVDYGTGLYLILALIIFCETGLVVTPFLPGDSLLFATGALLAMGLPNLSIGVMIPLLIAAAIVGDTVNFHVGRYMSARVLAKGVRWLNPKHLERTTEFFDRHGGKTVVLARFLPILRTYVPFVSGLTGMPYRRFLMFSVFGGTIWIASFLTLGYLFGNIPAVKTNFHYVIIGIIVLSLVPIALDLVRGRRSARAV